MKKIEASRTTCCCNDIDFSVDEFDYNGTLQIIGHYGASVKINRQLDLPKGKKIRMTIMDNSHKEVKNAEVVWSDVSEFGVKFIYPRHYPE